MRTMKFQIQMKKISLSLVTFVGKSSQIQLLPSVNIIFVRVVLLNNTKSQNVVLCVMLILEECSTLLKIS